MTSETTGSYEVDTMSEPNKELDRLRKQAEMFTELETGILKKCGLAAHHDVLELGSGPGFISKILAQVACDGKLISVDNDAKLLGILKNEVINPPKGGHEALHASANDVPVDDDWADFTYARFLVQHVPNPQTVVDEAYRATKPGGIFCIVDSDDGLVVQYPEDNRVSGLLRQAEEAQEGRGGDRFIGRKAAAMMHAAGFKKVNASIMMMTSTEIPFRALYGILLGYKSTLINRQEDATRMLEELEAASARGDYLLSAGVFITTGIK